MKQCITETEVLALPDEHVAKIIKLTYAEYPVNTIIYKINRYKNHKLGSKQLSVDLTIGKMIEILGFKLINILGPKGLKDRYTVEICTYDESSDIDANDIITWCKDELCDCLWEALKEVLGE